MTARMQITLDPDVRKRVRHRASALGISLAEYIRRVVAKDLGEKPPAVDPSAIFDLVKSGQETDIARDKDRLIGEAIVADYERKTRRGRVRR